MQREERSLQGEVRAEGNGRRVSGHAARFNSRSGDLGGFVEEIKPGAFAGALQRHPDVILNFNHENNYILGRTTANTLTVREDDRGLYFEAELPDTQTVNDLILSPMRRGELRGTSFAFTAKPPVARGQYRETHGFELSTKWTESMMFRWSHEEHTMPHPQAFAAFARPRMS